MRAALATAATLFALTLPARAEEAIHLQSFELIQSLRVDGVTDKPAGSEPVGHRYIVGYVVLYNSGEIIYSDGTTDLMAGTSIVPPSGEFAGRENSIATLTESGWMYWTPDVGTMATTADGRVYHYQGGRGPSPACGWPSASCAWTESAHSPRVLLLDESTDLSVSYGLTWFEYVIIVGPEAGTLTLPNPVDDPGIPGREAIVENGTQQTWTVEIGGTSVADFQGRLTWFEVPPDSSVVIRYSAAGNRIYYTLDS